VRGTAVPLFSTVGGVLQAALDVPGPGNHHPPHPGRWRLVPRVPPRPSRAGLLRGTLLIQTHNASRGTNSAREAPFRSTEIYRSRS